MLAVSIVLFFICVFLSMMMALFDQDKKSDTKTFSTLSVIFIHYMDCPLLGIIVLSHSCLIFNHPIYGRLYCSWWHIAWAYFYLRL